LRLVHVLLAPLRTLKRLFVPRYRRDVVSPYEVELWWTAAVELDESVNSFADDSRASGYEHADASALDEAIDAFIHKLEAVKPQFAKDDYGLALLQESERAARELSKAAHRIAATHGVSVRVNQDDWTALARSLGVIQRAAHDYVRLAWSDTAERRSTRDSLSRIVTPPWYHGASYWDEVRRDIASPIVVKPDQELAVEFESLERPPLTKGANQQVAVQRYVRFWRRKPRGSA
jgi:hypothetical protein